MHESQNLASPLNSPFLFYLGFGHGPVIQQRPPGFPGKYTQNFFPTQIIHNSKNLESWCNLQFRCLIQWARLCNPDTMFIPGGYNTQGNRYQGPGFQQPGLIGGGFNQQRPIKGGYNPGFGGQPSISGSQSQSSSNSQTGGGRGGKKPFTF